MIYSKAQLKFALNGIFRDLRLQGKIDGNVCDKFISDILSIVDLPDTSDIKYDKVIRPMRSKRIGALRPL